MKQWMANCRGCGKLIVWTKMQSGRPMPCDPEIIRFSKGGTQAYVTPDGFVIHGTPKPDGELMGYISHFATCPKANGFRKG